MTAGRRRLSPASDGLLTRNEVWAFRKMAAHPDVVGRVIDESTDDDPPSRRKVMAAIRRTETAPACDKWHGPVVRIMAGWARRTGRIK